MLNIEKTKTSKVVYTNESGQALGSDVTDGVGREFSKLVWVFVGRFSDMDLVRYYESPPRTLLRINAQIATMPVPFPANVLVPWRHIDFFYEMLY